MTINIRATGIELTPSLRQYVEDKFSMLEKYEHSIQQIDVHIGKETNHHQKGDIYTCSTSVQFPKDLLKVERSEADQYKAIDKVKDHLRETLAQRKEKVIDAHRKRENEE